MRQRHEDVGDEAGFFLDEHPFANIRRKRGERRNRITADRACAHRRGQSFGGTYPDATSAPPPKKWRSICSARYFRARGSARLRRFSLTSIVCWRSHCAQASLDTFSKMRLPSSPGYVGKSRPSASRPSLTQFTMRAIDKNLLC